MKTNKKMGENHSNYTYTPKEIYSIKKSNYLCKCIDYLACKIEKFAELYEKSISREYEKESKMFDISESNNIIHVGCGAYPITAITLAKMNDKKIVAIDRNPRTVKLAKQVINKKNLHDLIIIENGDGRSYPLERFDTIIVSSCSIPKIEILKHVFKTAKPNSKIIVRELYGASRVVVNCIGSHEDIELVKKIGNHTANFKWESFYLIKK